MRIIICYYFASFCIYSSPFCVCCLLTIFFYKSNSRTNVVCFNAVENIELCMFRVCENIDWRFLSFVMINTVILVRSVCVCECVCVSKLSLLRVLSLERRIGVNLPLDCIFSRIRSALLHRSPSTQAWNINFPHPSPPLIYNVTSSFTCFAAWQELKICRRARI